MKVSSLQLLAFLVACILANTLDLAEDSVATTTTVTETKTVLPVCFQNKLDDVFDAQVNSSQPEETQGIKVVFVYEPNEIPQPEATTLATTFVNYLKKTSTSVDDSGTVLHYYTESETLTTEIVSYGCDGCEKSPNLLSQPYISNEEDAEDEEYDLEAEQEDDEGPSAPTCMPQVPTTTTIIYIARVTPEVLPFESSEAISSTMRNPLALGGLYISKSLEYSIDTRTLTQGILLSTTLIANASESDFFSEYTTSTTVTFTSSVTNGTIPANAKVLTSTSEELSSYVSSSAEVIAQADTIALVSSYPVTSTSNSSSIATSAAQISSVRYTNSSSSISSNNSTQTYIPIRESGYSSYSSENSSYISQSLAYSSEVESSSLELSTISTSAAPQNVSTVSSSIISESSSSLLPVFFAFAAPVMALVTVSNANGFTGDIFQPISTAKTTLTFKRQNLPLALPAGATNDGQPYQTNKFYSNLFLGPQTDTVYAQPFNLAFVKSGYYGFGVQRTIASRRVFGTQNTNNPSSASYYFNPIHLNEMIVSATAFTSGIKMHVSVMRVMSVNVKLSTNGDISANYVEIPIVQGMGFVTSIYHGNLIPQINSGVGFSKLAQESSSTLNKANLLRYRATLFNGVQYLIYVKIPSGQSISSFKLSVSNNNKIVGSKAINGLIIQYAIAATAAHNTYYDEAAGMYPTQCNIKATGNGGTSADYQFNYVTLGKSISGRPVVFLYPHHVESLKSDTKSYNTGMTLTSTTKGDMKGYVINNINLSEKLNTNVQFLPWTQSVGSKAITYTAAQLKTIAAAANLELSVDIKTLVMSQNSNYYSGKVLDKFAYILFVVNDIIGDQKLAKSLLATLKDTFAQFRNNKQYYPLMYDTRYFGITSTCNNNGDTGADFGSGYYNDHHFHYGYFIHAAAIIGYVDKKYGGTWAKDQQPWVNALVRDVSNPSTSDPNFPVFRMYDWFSGHSWAAGLFASGDGKNEESSSEDYNFAYGLKLWGKVTGNKRMESTGDLMLAVLARAMNKYMLYTSTNKVEPSQILGNKVSGIFFENKIDYTTYFGSPDKNPEYVHGIHMLPITPASSLIRGPAYTKEEWNSQISKFLSKVNSGWTGILRLNQALFDPKSAWNFFSASSFKSSWLDNGQSRTWALAFSAGVMNASS